MAKTEPTPATRSQEETAVRGTRTMGVLLFGQAFSLVGSGLTAFALGIKIFQDTGSVTQMGTLVMFASLPAILLYPLAGVIVDRCDRRWVLILSNIGAALSTLSLTIPLITGRLDFWELCLPLAVVSSLTAVQSPAYSVTTTLLVPRQHLGRINGVSQFLAASVQIVTPLLGGILITRIKVFQIIWIDVATYLVAVLTLAIVRIPRSPNSVSETARRSFFKDITFGWSYFRQKRDLLVLLLLGAFVNFTLTFGQVLTVPVVLGISTPYALGVIQMIGGVGVVFGSLLLVAWGIRQRQLRTMVRLTLLFGLALACVGLRPSLFTMAASIFVGWFCIPLVSGCLQVIFQTKIPVEVQGRVFATRLMIGRSTVPLAPLIAGALADRFFAPLLLPGGALSGSVGAIIGVGNGRGAALLLIVAGMATILVTAAAFQSRHLRMLDEQEPCAVDAQVCGHPARMRES